MINKTLKIAPLIGSLLVFCGVLKLIFYYSHFGISITNYLEFQEILTLFLADLNILIVFLIIMTIVTFASIDLLSKNYKVKTDELIYLMDKYVYPRRYGYVWFFFLLSVTLTVLVITEVFDLNYLVIYLLTFSVIQGVSFLLLKQNEDGDVYLSDFSNFMVITFGLTCAIYLLARKDIQMVEDSITTTKLVLSERTINCGLNSNCLYLGKTKNFVFIKSKDNTSVLVLPIEQVDELIFK